MYIGVFIRNPITQMLNIKTDKPTVFADSQGNIIETLNIVKGVKSISKIETQDIEIKTITNIEEKMQNFSESMIKLLSKFGTVYKEKDGFFVIESKGDESELTIEKITGEVEMNCVICISDNIKIINAVCPILEESRIINEEDFRENRLEDIENKEEIRERIELAFYDEDEILDNLSGKMIKIQNDKKEDQIGEMLDKLINDENLVYPLSCDLYLLIIKEGTQIIKKIILKQDSKEDIVEKVSKSGKSAEMLGLFIYASKSGKDRLTKFFAK